MASTGQQYVLSNWPFKLSYCTALNNIACQVIAWYWLELAEHGELNCPVMDIL